MGEKSRVRFAEGFERGWLARERLIGDAEPANGGIMRAVIVTALDRVRSDIGAARRNLNGMVSTELEVARGFLDSALAEIDTLRRSTRP